LNELHIATAKTKLDSDHYDTRVTTYQLK